MASNTNRLMVVVGKRNKFIILNMETAKSRTHIDNEYIEEVFKSENPIDIINKMNQL